MLWRLKPRVAVSGKDKAGQDQDKAMPKPKRRDQPVVSEEKECSVGCCQHTFFTGPSNHVLTVSRPFMHPSHQMTGEKRGGWHGIARQRELKTLLFNNDFERTMSPTSQ